MQEQPLPEPWGFPRPYKGKTGGAVWHGQQPATKVDIEALHKLSPTGRALIDERTLCGTNDSAWTTYYEEMTAEAAKQSPWMRFRRRFGK